jgi:hypothetical protein
VVRRSAALIAVIFAIVLSPLLSGCATSSEAGTVKVEQHAQQAALVLAKRPDADSLAAAGALSRGGILSEVRHPDRSLALLAQAAAAAPERPELAWLHAQACQEAPPCEAEPIERRLRALDPSNGAGWMGALARADASSDVAALDAALLAMSTSNRVDIYWTRLVPRLSRAASEAGTMSLDEAEILIVGYLAGEAISGYTAASHACKGQRLEKRENIEICRGVAKAFQRGDTYMSEMVGIAIAKRVWPEDSQEYKSAVEGRRVYQYRADKLLKVLTSQRSEWTTEKYLTLVEQNHREQDVYLAELVEAGVNPNPPPE